MAYEDLRPKQWKIPEKRVLDYIGQYFTRLDALLCLIAKVLIDIDNRIGSAGGREHRGAVERPVTINLGPLVYAIRSLMAEIDRLSEAIRTMRTRVQKSIIAIPPPLMFIDSEKISVSNEKDATVNISDETDVILIQNIGSDDVKFSLTGNTSDSSPRVYAGSQFTIRVPESKRTLFLRAVNTSSEVIVSEWKFAQD